METETSSNEKLNKFKFNLFVKNIIYDRQEIEVEAESFDQALQKVKEKDFKILNMEYESDSAIETDEYELYDENFNKIEQ